ncbi:MAG TPA: tail fiber protein, partial [Polyangia bacterium]|nr:tail fiber protein [Polyangia bacterium]
DTTLRPDGVLPAGGIGAHENRPPFLGLPHRLAHNGVFPVAQGQDPFPFPFLGEVRIFALPFIPDGWAECNGQEIPGEQGQMLLQLFGETYGKGIGGGVILPDLSGRTAVGASAQPAPGLTARPLGQQGGAEVVTLEVQHLPAHTHEVRARASAGGVSSPDGNVFGASQARALSSGYSPAPPAVPMSPSAVGPAGQGQPHNNMAPFLTLRFCISLFGELP